MAKPTGFVSALASPKNRDMSKKTTRMASMVFPLIIDSALEFLKRWF
jgi:hypothetical protein